MRITPSVSRPLSQAIKSTSTSSWSSGAAATTTAMRSAGWMSMPSRMATQPMLRTPFSTSSRVQQTAEEKKETENKAAGEAMGAKDGKAESAGEASELDKLQATIKEKDVKIKELTDAVLYGKADLQNAQRRAQEEKSQAGDYAITKFARDLTSSLDILNLALRSVPEPLRKAPEDAKSLDDPRRAISELYSGVELTSKSILDMLKLHGVTVFDPTGEKFNPQEHEAMFQAPVPGKEPGTVLECSKVGFRIKDRVLRAAQVGVVQETS
ncbi:GrpE-domain-containing protein [Meira miltonrushii]|uniref:GrpE protein homolog n=1 Tax=Meira miltonrushii TaxID=1280837 RepID=A0A316VCS6_9BASI|nr:GrpE-domain-containing protein [Meira miltonrushii]PWN35439.1 GrpE-domain-containing protein [Meira miltonrushii]